MCDQCNNSPSSLGEYEYEYELNYSLTALCGNRGNTIISLEKSTYIYINIVVIIVKIYIYTHTVYTHKTCVSTLCYDLSDYCHNKSYRQFKSTLSISSLTTSGRDVYSCQSKQIWQP